MIGVIKIENHIFSILETNFENDCKILIKPTTREEQMFLNEWYHKRTNLNLYKRDCVKNGTALIFSGFYVHFYSLFPESLLYYLNNLEGVQFHYDYHEKIYEDLDIFTKEEQYLIDSLRGINKFNL